MITLRNLLSAAALLTSAVAAGLVIALVVLTIKFLVEGV